MLKYALLAGSMLIASPVLAQTATPAAPAASQTAPAPTAPAAPAAPTTAAPPAAAAPDAQAATPAPADPATAATPAPADPAVAAAPAPAAPAAAAPAPGAQVADIVGKEFPAYDKDGNGSLSKAEFSTWMLALKKAGDPAAKDDTANKTWTTGAFAAADTDKSKSISKDELTNFLAQGQSKAS